MAEILKDEIMSDAELDGVAGGTAAESAKDRDFLRAIGALNPGQGSDIAGVTRAFAQLGIGYVQYNEDRHSTGTGTPLAIPIADNEYYINGKQVTRAEALMKAASKSKAKIDLRTGGLLDVTNYL